jgi:hypothetical protein
MGVTAYRGLAAQFPAADPQQRRVEPFRSAEDAWLWTMAALVARREGAPMPANAATPGCGARRLIGWSGRCA